MKTAEFQSVVITGIGMVTPLGDEPGEVLRRIQAGETAAAAPTEFDASRFACPICAQVKDFQPHRFVSEAKMVRLMNRDAQLAVAAARLALEDAGVKSGVTYPSEAIALFGATGLAGLPLREVVPLIRVSAGLDGAFDLAKFGQAGLKAVSPILSFKILSNMPFCFVSINENIQGPNTLFTPWEGQGAQAIEAGIRALIAGDASCALVGGCDVKTHELAFASLQQQGLFDSWTKPGAQLANGGPGLIPGEGAAFLVLENEASARARGAPIYAQIRSYGLCTHCSDTTLFATRSEVLGRLNATGEIGAVVSSANGDTPWEQVEETLLKTAGISAGVKLEPKKQVGDLFAAAALLQLGLGAQWASQHGKGVLANCFGHGSEQAAFLLH